MLLFFFYIDISKNLKPSKIIIIIEKNVILRAKVKYWCYTLQSQFSHLHRGGQSLNDAVNLFTKKKSDLSMANWQTDVANLGMMEEIEKKQS